MSTVNFHVEWVKIGIERKREQDEWIATLRAQGVKAAHPDDGWVDRMENSVFFAYPQFNDGAQVGDLVALGWPQWDCIRPQHRIVRLIGFLPGMVFKDRWLFEEVQ